MKKIYFYLLIASLAIFSKVNAQWSSTSAPYCVGSYVSSYTPCGDGAWISHVTFGTINYTASCNSTYPWYRYWGASLGSAYTTILIPGNTYTLFAQPGTTSVPSSWGAWIDFNGNNSFADAGEFIWGNSTTPTGGQTIPNISVTIPTSAIPGTHRMRLRNMWQTGSNPFFGLTSPQYDACASVNEDGETVDFDITIPSTGAQIPPLAGFAYNIAMDTAWTNSPYIFVNTSNNASNSFWDVIGYSSTLNGTYTAFNPPATSPRVCVSRWNTCYIDTLHQNFSWKFTQPGYYKVKLKVTNTILVNSVFVNGVDSITKIIICSPPTRKPVASFFSLNRSVGFTDQLNYYDLSTNGPTNWRWFLNPSYYGVNTFAGYPIANSWYATDSVQNPYLYAFDGGIFDVCLAAGNALGWDTLCRHNYLQVNNGYMMCNGSDSVSFLSSGYVYDAGGPTSNYTGGTTGSCPAGFRIAACADSIRLDIERFKLIAGDSLTIRVGTPTGAIIKRLGGQTLHDSLRHYKVPGGFVFFQMNAASTSVGDSGFAIHWGIVPASYGKPKASFTMTTNGPTTNGIPSIYRGYAVNYTSTSTGVNMSYSWDTDGNGIYGTSIGGDSINQNPSWATTAGTTVGLYNVCLRVSNCVGTDSVCKQIRVLPVPS